MMFLKALLGFFLVLLFGSFAVGSLAAALQALGEDTGWRSFRDFIIYLFCSAFWMTLMVFVALWATP